MGGNETDPQPSAGGRAGRVGSGGVGREGSGLAFSGVVFVLFYARSWVYLCFPRHFHLVICVFPRVKYTRRIYVHVKYDLHFFWLAALRRPSISSRTFGRGAS